MPERVPIQFKPGVFRQGSEAEMTGNWYETHLVRWVGNVLRPIDGWEKVNTTAFASKVRKVHVWVDRPSGQKWIAVLCEQHLYVVDQGGDVHDISPTPPIVGPDETVDGGYGDDIYFGAGGGLAPPNAPPDGATPLPPLYTDPLGYGMPRPDHVADTRIIGPMWSLDNFGDDLLAMSSVDRRLLQWKPADGTGVPAFEVVADTGKGTVPKGRFFVVTPERHVMIFEDGNKFNTFGWCSQENLTDWLFTDTTNTAGSYDLEPATPFVTAVATRYGILAFTAVEAYLITYYSSPYIYSYTFLGQYNAPLTGDSIVALANRTFWQSSDGFWFFDGVNIAPLACPILDWVQQTSDPYWRYRRPTAIPIGVQSEVWFFFPSVENTENTHYAQYNFDEKWWSMGRLSRTCGVAGSALTYPIMSNGQFLYFHEKGRFYADAPELPYAQSAAINIASGARQSTLRQGIVDTRAPNADVQFWIGARKARISNPTNAEDVQLSLVPLRDRGRLDFRITGRDAIIRIQSLRNGAAPWTFGQMLVKQFPRGRR